MNLFDRPLFREMRGVAVRELHQLLARVGMEIPSEDAESERFGRGTHEIIVSIQERHRLPPTGVVDGPTADLLGRLAGTFHVTGLVSSPNRAGTAGLQVEVYDAVVGGELHVGSAKTDPSGRYSVAFSGQFLREQKKPNADLFVRVLHDNAVLATSDVHYNASTSETIDVILPEDVQAQSEHEALAAAIAAHYGGALSDLKETDKQRDLSYLANKTGWDARAIALAALADKFSRSSSNDGPVIPAPLYYALFRVGLPADDTLYEVDTESVVAAWKQAIDSGVIAASHTSDLAVARRIFQTRAANHKLSSNPTETSTLADVAGLVLGSDGHAKSQFAEMLVASGGDASKLWTAATSAFGVAKATQLQLVGQLAFLTSNNAPLIARLQKEIPQLASPVDLVRHGYHDPSKWSGILDGNVPVPSEIPGNDAAEKRGNYAAALAAQLRLGFPTAVVAELVRSNALVLRGSGGVREAVYKFLVDQEGKFEIGKEPVERFLKRTPGVRLDDTVRDEIKRLQRVYQITTTDKAMAALLANDLDSSFKIARWDERTFVDSFKEVLGNERTALLTYSKAVEVHNAVLNLALRYLTARRAPTIGSNTEAFLLAPNNTGGADEVASATLETLFGSMDFCACDACRSMLSPAAYLVDLLMFLDSPKPAKENPQDVLFDRRPDIQHLPLTCENTNKPLPYIDLVLETLEYFVTHRNAQKQLTLDGFEGHDTDREVDVTELLADPQFVDDNAYATLTAAKFPPPLPFHRSLELLRRHHRTFDLPLQASMEALRVDEALDRGTRPYGWRDILMEEVGFSRPEYAILTGAVGFQESYGYDPAKPIPDVIAALSPAKAFARRLAVSYEELVAILGTRFINPSIDLLPLLEALNLPFVTLQALESGAISDADFDKLLPAGFDQTPYGGDVKAWIRDPDVYKRIMSLIILVNTEDEDRCSFDQLELRYSDPANFTLRQIDFVRFLRFVRLWKKLGWSIADTDRAIAALYPQANLPTGNEAADLKLLDDGFVILLQRLGIASRVARRLSIAAKDRASLLALWGPIDTTGDSLYRRMFLARGTADPAFEPNKLGRYLTTTTEKLLPHGPTLRAAFNITDAELALIATELGIDATTTLDLASISAIYRRGWLARKLHLSVRELLLLVKRLQVDPFAMPDPTPAPIEQLLDAVDAMHATSMKPVQALYLFWNDDLSGKSAPKDADVRGFARTLRQGFAQIEADFTIADDPTGEIAHARMALVYGNEATDFFFGLLADMFKVTVSYAQVAPDLDPAVVAIGKDRLAYDPFRKELSYTGILDAATSGALQGVAGATTAFKKAIADLFDMDRASIGPFFDAYPELRALLQAYRASTDPPEKKRTALLASILPTLKRRRKRQQGLAAMTAAAGTDATFATALLDDAAVFHASGAPASPALEDLIAIEQTGFAADFYWSDTIGPAPDLSRDTERSAAYAPATDNVLPANPGGGAISAVWTGYIEAPQNGFFDITIDTDAATVSLSIDGQAIALTRSGTAWSSSTAITLAAGALARIELRAEKLASSFSVRWSSVGLGREVIPQTRIYSARLVERLRATYIRFLKATSLASILHSSASEIAHLAADPLLAIGGAPWLNVLPVTGTSGGLRKIFEALLSYGRMKQALAPDDDRLLAIVSDPKAKLENGDSALETLTGWSADSINALLARFGKTIDDLKDIVVLERLFDAQAVVATLGISAQTLVASMTNEPTAQQVRNFQAALRARYDAGAWLDVLKPINDEVRALSRDALVAYVLETLGQDPKTAAIDSPDKLFEWFLMDVQMDPCMETSRVRHALSSVQLFVERILLNLEPRVAQSSIVTKWWDWMKRYRVWEANRKVFLWPENWLEPELRDDPSPFFKEAMSELLQSDITEDTAAVAMLNYLSKLEDVAKLEPCTLCLDEGSPGTSDDVIHVVARTAGGHRKYFHRRCEQGTWTPWEQIRLDIEDNPVLLYVWRGRPFLFWIKILKETPIQASKLPETATQGDKPLADVKLSEAKKDGKKDAQKIKVTVKAILCFSEYYNGKWQPTKTSDVNRPTELGDYDPAPDSPDAFDRAAYVMGAFEEEQGDGQDTALRISFGDGTRGGGYLLYNTHSAPVRGEDAPLHIKIGAPPPRRALDTSTDTFTARYIPSSIDPGFSPGSILVRPILKNEILDRTIAIQHPIEKPWDGPFFYVDDRNAFFVTTEESTVAIGKFTGFGSWFVPPIQIEFPPIVLKPIPKTMDPLGSLIGRLNGVIDPSPIERVVSDGAAIHTALGMTGPVRYGDREIGLVGAVGPRSVR